MLSDGLATTLDRASAFEHLQALIANGPDLEDLDEWDDVLTRAAAFCKSGTLLSEVESFCKEHAGGFEVVEEGEYPLYFTQLHEEYAARIEDRLEDFLKSQGCSIENFYETCKACLERSRTEQRWNKDAMFVQVLTASTEFEEFVGLMRVAARFLQLPGSDEAGEADLD